MSEKGKKPSGSPLSNGAKTAALFMLALVCSVGLYIAVIMGEPDGNEGSGSDAVKQEIELTAFSELAGRDEFFAYPVLLLNEGQGYSFVSGSCRKTERGGIVELKYASDSGAALILLSVAPKDDLSLVSGSDYTLIPDSGAYLAGAKGVLMHNKALNLRIHVVSQDCLYICFGQGMSQSDFKLLAQSMQVY